MFFPLHAEIDTYQATGVVMSESILNYQTDWLRLRVAEPFTDHTLTVPSDKCII